MRYDPKNDSSNDLLEPGDYEAVVTADVERFAISREHALGLHTFLDAVGRLGTDRPAWLRKALRRHQG